MIAEVINHNGKPTTEYLEVLTILCDPLFDQCFNPYTAGDLFGQYKTNKQTDNRLKHRHMGTHRRVLSESYPINSNMTGLMDIKQLFVRSALALEGLRNRKNQTLTIGPLSNDYQSNSFQMR